MTQHISVSNESTSSIIARTSISDTLFSKEYCFNQYNLLRGFSLVVCLILFFISLLYCTSSMYKLELADFWCDQYSYQEILQHNRMLNSSKGVGNCFRDELKGLYVDHGKLFGKNDQSDAFVAKIKDNITSSDVLELLLFSVLVCGFASLFLYYLLICLIDCRKTIQNDWMDQNRGPTFVSNEQVYCYCCCNKKLDPVLRDQCPRLFEYYIKFYKWRLTNFGYDKPLSILALLMKQLIEIFLQS